jgi:DNA polymerase III subunit epsilon
MLSTELLTYYRQLSRQQFTVVDVETTGKNASVNRVMEVSILRATLAKGVQRQETALINPQIPIPERIARFTGISQSLVETAPTAAEVLPDYLPLLSTGVLTAHNIEFDYPFLQAEYSRLGTDFVRPESDRFCTVQLSRLMLPDLPSRSLPDLVAHFQFKVGQSHRAEADTQACWLLAERLLTEILNESDQVVLARFAQQWMPLKYAAKLLGCSQREGRSRLSAAGVPSRAKQGSGILMYRRGDVEQVFYKQQDKPQLSWL